MEKVSIEWRKRPIKMNGALWGKGGIWGRSLCGSLQWSEGSFSAVLKKKKEISIPESWEVLASWADFSFKS